MSSVEQAPPCPITGLPARRRIQTVSTALLIGLWRWGAGVDVTRLLKGRSITLWESPCGLAFFHPMIAGDEGFYARFYRHIHPSAFRAHLGERSDFLAAARLVKAGDEVLDVACGTGEFSRYVPEADYVGLEPNPAASQPGVTIVHESLEAHAARHAGGYDAVCAFQVIEHVTDPLGFARTLFELVRPGGLLILAAPTWPSPMTEIPNCIGNAAPHHLSWWTRGAFQALAERLGGEIVALENLPPNRHQILFHWMRKISPVKAHATFFEPRPSWSASLALAFAGALVAALPNRLPRDAASMDMLLALRRPA